MSTRKDIRDAIIAAIQTLLGESYTVSAFGGDAEAMAANEIGVQYLGMKSGELQEIGASTYEREFYYAVFYPADVTTAAGRDAPLTEMETVEEGMAGVVLASYGQARIVSHPQLELPETLIESKSGRALYVQCWAVGGEESH